MFNFSCMVTIHAHESKIKHPLPVLLKTGNHPVYLRQKIYSSFKIKLFSSALPLQPDIIDGFDQLENGQKT